MSAGRSPLIRTFDHGGRRTVFAWTLLCCLLLWAAMAGPFFAGRIYTFDDLGAFHLPLRWFYAVCLARGESFDWLPHLFSGFYLTGEGQVGTYHPLHWVLYRWLDFRAAFCLELLATYPLMLAGMFLFLRRRLGRRDAALWGALVFTFGGFNLLHFMHMNAVAIVAHIAWLLWAIDIVARDANRRKVIAAELAIAVLTGSQLLLGYPQYVWFSLLAEGAYALFLIFLDDPPSLAKKTSFNRRAASWLPRIGAAKLLGLLIGAVQLMATYEALQISARDKVDAGFRTIGSLHPLNLVQLVAPYLFVHRVAGQNTHELGLYCGAVPTVLCVWWLLGLRAKLNHRRLAWAACGLGTVSLWMAFGKYGSLYALQAYLPLVGGFRCPSRYIVLFQLAGSVVAAVAFGELMRGARGHRGMTSRDAVSLGLPVVVSLAVVLLAVLPGPRESIAGLPYVAGGPILIGLAALLVGLAIRGVRWAPVALVVLTTVDLGGYGLSYAVYRQTPRLGEFLAGIPALPGEEHDRVAFDLARLGEPVSAVGDRLLLRGERRVDGYAGLPPRKRLDYHRVASLRAAGVRWVRRTTATAKIAGLRASSDRWFEVPDPLPRVRLVSRGVVSRRPAEQIESMPLTHAVLVEHPMNLPHGPSGVARILEERPGRIRIRTVCFQPRLLTLAESHHPGWRAFIDQKPLPVLRVNGDFLGCLVPPGEHEICFEFRPAELRWGRFLSLAAILVAGGVFVPRWMVAQAVNRETTA